MEDGSAGVKVLEPLTLKGALIRLLAAIQEQLAMPMHAQPRAMHGRRQLACAAGPRACLCDDETLLEEIVLDSCAELLCCAAGRSCSGRLCSAALRDRCSARQGVLAQRGGHARGGRARQLCSTAVLRDGEIMPEKLVLENGAPQLCYAAG